MVPEVARVRRLRVEFFLPRAEQREDVVTGIIDVAVEIDRRACLGFQCLGRLARHEVDRPAHRAGAVEHRGIALGDLDFGNVGGQEAAIVEPVVGGQIDADTVERHGHLEAVEPADEDQSLVA